MNHMKEKLGMNNHRKNRRLNSGAIALGLFLLFSARSVWSAEPLTVGSNAPDFTLQDAEDHVYELTKMRGEVVVLFFGSRSLRTQNRTWAKGLKEAFPDREKLAILMVADMRGIPFFLTQSFIKGTMKRDPPPVPLLLDWGQKVNTLFGTKKDAITIVVIDAHGIAVHIQHNATYSQEAFEQLKPIVEAILSK